MKPRKTVGCLARPWSRGLRSVWVSSAFASGRKLTSRQASSPFRWRTVSEAHFRSARPYHIIGRPSVPETDQGFESGFLQQTVSLSPEFGCLRREAEVFRGYSGGNGWH